MVIRQEMWMHLLSRIYELVWIREKVYVSAYTKISANCLRLGAGPISLLLGDFREPTRMYGSLIGIDIVCERHATYVFHKR
jgi:hypothetical protein